MQTIKTYIINSYLLTNEKFIFHNNKHSHPSLYYDSVTLGIHKKYYYLCFLTCEEKYKDFMCMFKNSLNKCRLLQVHSKNSFFKTIVGYHNIKCNKQVMFDTVKCIDSVLLSLKT
jgi:hypothetical protein